jgi:hypothetical protein
MNQFVHLVGDKVCLQPEQKYEPHTFVHSVTIKNENGQAVLVFYSHYVGDDGLVPLESQEVFKLPFQEVLGLAYFLESFTHSLAKTLMTDIFGTEERKDNGQ